MTAPRPLLASACGHGDTTDFLGATQDHFERDVENAGVAAAVFFAFGGADGYELPQSRITTKTQQTKE
jgi:hypothetical protein